MFFIFLVSTVVSSKSWLLAVSGCVSFETKMAALTTTLKQQIDKEAELNNEIAIQLAKIGLTL